MPARGVVVVLDGHARGFPPARLARRLSATRTRSSLRHMQHLRVPCVAPSLSSPPARTLSRNRLGAAEICSAPAAGRDLKPLGRLPIRLAPVPGSQSPWTSARLRKSQGGYAEERERGPVHSGSTVIHIRSLMDYPQRDSNPCCRLERVTTASIGVRWCLAISLIVLYNVL